MLVLMIAFILPWYFGKLFGKLQPFLVMLSRSKERALCVQTSDTFKREETPRCTFSKIKAIQCKIFSILSQLFTSLEDQAFYLNNKTYQKLYTHYKPLVCPGIL